MTTRRALPLAPLLALFLLGVSGPGRSADLSDLRAAAEESAPGPAETSAPADDSGVRVPQIGSGTDRTSETLSLSSIPLLKTKLWTSANFTVDPTVQADGYYYIFTVRTAEGTEHKVVSVRELIKFCHELDVLAEYRKTETGSHIGEGLGQAVRGVGAGFGRLVTHPGQSVNTVGAGFGRFGRATGRFFTSPFRPKKQVLAADGTDRALLGKGPAGPERRLLAYELGLDVYTANPDIQEFLNEVGRKRLAGKLPINTTVFALPGGSVFTLSLTPMGHDKSTETLVVNCGPDELKRDLGLRYGELFGLSYGTGENAVTLLLDNPNFTPRQQAYIWRYFTDLGSLSGAEQAIDFLAAVDTPEDADVAVEQLELLSLLHQRGRTMARFVPLRNTLGAMSSDRILCFLISRDTVRYWSDVKTSLELALQAGREVGAKRVEFWSTGDVDTRSEKLAESMGILVYQNVLQYPQFQREREGMPAPGSVGPSVATLGPSPAPRPAELPAPAPSGSYEALQGRF